MDFVTREEFDAVKEMAANARKENDRLEARIAALEVAKVKPRSVKKRHPQKRGQGKVLRKRIRTRFTYPLHFVVKRA